MNLGFVDRPTVLHEFGHSLGLIHEHQSPFPGGFEWNRENVSIVAQLVYKPKYIIPHALVRECFLYCSTVTLYSGVSL